MIQKKLIAIVGAVAMVGMIQTAQATFLSDLTTYDSVTGTYISNGRTLAIGDKIFSGFSYQESGLSGFNAGAITVVASQANGVDYLTYGGNIQIAGTSFATGDLLLGYTVTATAGSINMIDQRYTGGAVNGGILINETATSGSPTAHSQLSLGDVSDPNTYPGHAGSFDTGELDLLGVQPSQTTLIVTKDLAFTILNGTLVNPISQASVSLVEQSFHQVVPEPTTVIAGALLLLPFGASTLRILRKNRTV